MHSKTCVVFVSVADACIVCQKKGLCTRLRRERRRGSVPWARSKGISPGPPTRRPRPGGRCPPGGQGSPRPGGWRPPPRRRGTPAWPWGQNTQGGQRTQDPRGVTGQYRGRTGWTAHPFLPQPGPWWSPSGGGSRGGQEEGHREATNRKRWGKAVELLLEALRRLRARGVSCHPSFPGPPRGFTGGCR
jgi:hypothetical protein